MTSDATSRVTRRRFLTGMAAAGGAAALAACGSNPRDQTTPATAGGGPTTAAAQTVVGAAPARDAGVTSFMNWDDIRDTPIEAVIKEYEQQTGRKVENVPNPGTGNEYETKVRTMLAGGTAPDIMRVNDDFVRYYSIKDQVRDLSPYLKRDNIKPDDYFAPIYNFAKQPSGQYTAWSLGNQPRLIFYNVNAFKEAGVPLPPKEWTKQGWTWNDFLETAKKLTKPGERWGALVYDDTGMEQTFAVNNGVESGIYSEDGKKFTLASPKGAEALQFLADLTCKHQVQPERGLVDQPGVPNLGNNLFVGGKVAMAARTQGTINYFRRNIPKVGEPGHFEFDVAPIPGNVAQKSEGSLICFAVTKPAKNPDGAWELLEFMGGPEGAKIFAARGAFIPAYKAAADLIQPGKEPPSSYPANIQLFVQATEHATVVNFTENTENARNIYRDELDKAWTCQESVKSVLDRVRPDVEEALSGKF